MSNDDEPASKADLCQVENRLNNKIDLVARQVGVLTNDMVEIKVDAAELKEDVAGLKVHVVELKVDLANHVNTIIEEMRKLITVVDQKHDSNLQDHIEDPRAHTGG